MELKVLYQPVQQEAPILEATEAAPAAAKTAAVAAAASAVAEPRRDAEERDLVTKINMLSQQEDPAEVPTGAHLFHLQPVTPGWDSNKWYSHNWSPQPVILHQLGGEKLVQ